MSSVQMTPIADATRSSALALLRAGCSYGEASDRTGLSLEEVRAIWKAAEADRETAL